MLFIHHHKDTERDEPAPPAIQRVARRTCEQAGPIAIPGRRLFVPATKPHMDQVRTSPAGCGANYWEIVIEATDL